MSIVRLVNVMRESEARLGHRLVLFVLAEYAHDDGTGSYPSIKTLTERTRMTRKGVQGALKGLEQDGRITRDGRGPEGQARWFVELAPTAADLESRPPDEQVDQAEEGGERGSPPRANDVRPGGPPAFPEGATRVPVGGHPGTPEPTPNPSEDPIFSSADADEDDQEKSSEEVIDLCELLGGLIRINDPKAKPQILSVRWRRDMRLLLSDRSGDAEEVERVLRWSQSDPFWKGNVLSPASLRRNFTSLLHATGRSTGPREERQERRRLDQEALQQLMTSGGEAS